METKKCIFCLEPLGNDYLGCLVSHQSISAANYMIEMYGFQMYTQIYYVGDADKIWKNPIFITLYRASRVRGDVAVLR